GRVGCPRCQYSLGRLHGDHAGYIHAGQLLAVSVIHTAQRRLDHAGHASGILQQVTRIEGGHMRYPLVLAAWIGMAAALYGQNASLSGFIKDPTSAIVPRAAVEIRSVETGVKFKTLSNDAGVYVFASL